MGIQKDCRVRYKSDGHVRFEIPKQLCDVSVAKKITEQIFELEGVYRVNLFRKQQKLAIHFQETVCDFKQLAIQLYQLLDTLEQQGQFATNTDIAVSPSEWKIASQLKQTKLSRWFNDQYIAVKETAQAAKVITQLGLKKPKSFIKDPEKTMIDFGNDILVLYLIKLHWTRITQEWLPHPWLFRYQWTAVFYLFYLLIRSRAK